MVRLKHHLTAYHPERPEHMLKNLPSTNFSPLQSRKIYWTFFSNLFNQIKSQKSLRQGYTLSRKGARSSEGSFERFVGRHTMGLFIPLLQSDMHIPRLSSSVFFSNKAPRERQVQNQCSRPRSYDSLHFCLLLWVNFKRNYILMA